MPQYILLRIAQSEDLVVKSKDWPFRWDWDHKHEFHFQFCVCYFSAYVQKLVLVKSSTRILYEHDFLAPQENPLMCSFLTHHCCSAKPMFANCQLSGSDCHALLLLTTVANCKLRAENAHTLRIYADSLTFNESLSWFTPHIWVWRHLNHYVLLITHYNVLPQIPPGFRSCVTAFRLNQEAALNRAITLRSIVFVRKRLSEPITLSRLCICSTSKWAQERRQCWQFFLSLYSGHSVW